MSDSNLPNTPLDKSAAPKSEKAIMLRPETGLVPITASAPTKSYSRRLLKHAYQQTRGHQKVELIATSILGFLIGALAGGFTWTGLALGVGGLFAAIGLLFVCYLMLAPRELDAALRGELEAARLLPKAESPAKRDYIIEQLKKLIDEEHTSRPSGLMGMKAMRNEMMRQMEWLQRTERFLKQYGYESYIPRLRKDEVIALEELLGELLS